MPSSIQSRQIGKVSIDWKGQNPGDIPFIQTCSFEINGQADTRVLHVFGHGDDVWAVILEEAPPRPIQNPVFRIHIIPGPSLYMQFFPEDARLSYLGQIVFDRRTWPYELPEPLRSWGHIASILAIGHILVEDIRGRDASDPPTIIVPNQEERPRRMITL